MTNYQEHPVDVCIKFDMKREIAQQSEPVKDMVDIDVERYLHWDESKNHMKIIYDQLNPTNMRRNHNSNGCNKQ